MIYALTLICLSLIALVYSINREWTNRMNEQELRFKEERQQLIDRIQAPTFSEYKQAEVRVIKAQKDEKPQPILHLE